ncbi:hypothetical protein CA265_01750 [Sphingobacteriaceae bacterium GW460-11-11-14-LB5]|nr:hypothetical protein CA265_01750 [Sphingobacteriaceae bacterium GW460-11-11-14-LB5]
MGRLINISKWLSDKLLFTGPNIINLQIQFHDFVPDAGNKMYELRTLLSKTHHPTYLCDFIWENWLIKHEI